MLLLKESSSSSSSSSSRTTKKYRRRRLFFRVVGVVIRVDKDGVVSLSLSFAAVYTKEEQMENNFTGVLFLGAHFFSYNLLRALLHKVDTISFLTTLRPFERVLARRNECTKALLVVFPRKEREREAVFFARVFSPFFFFLIKVSSSSLERKNFAKKNARVCFVKKEEEEECERVLFASFRKERRSIRSPSPERGAFLRRKVALSARVLYNERPAFFSPLIFLSKKKCSGKMRHKNRRHHRRLNAKRRRRRRRRRPRRNRKREKKRTTTRRTTTPPFIFLF